MACYSMDSYISNVENVINYNAVLLRSNINPQMKLFQLGWFTIYYTVYGPNWVYNYDMYLYVKKIWIHIWFDKYINVINR